MREYNFDALVGPTHQYAGLSHGNLASEAHSGLASNPRAGALEGLEKMRVVASLGAGQAVLPPQPRPDLAALRALGFSGSDGDVLGNAARNAPDLLRACSSASAMWAAISRASIAMSCQMRSLTEPGTSSSSAKSSSASISARACVRRFAQAA